MNQSERAQLRRLAEADQTALQKPWHDRNHSDEAAMAQFRGCVRSYAVLSLLYERDALEAEVRALRAVISELEPSRAALSTDQPEHREVG